MKIRRQKKIIEIIEKQIISTQDELAEALRATGYNVTQATVSRDIKELRLVKVTTGENEYRYGLPKEQEYVKNEERLSRLMNELVLSVAASENIIVLHTYPGNAPTIASLIDGSSWPEIIGTVAGDDTVLLIIKSLQETQARPEVVRMLHKLKGMME
jgi:transcriptional regulator of arginine metabolism